MAAAAAAVAALAVAVLSDRYSCDQWTMKLPCQYSPNSRELPGQPLTQTQAHTPSCPGSATNAAHTEHWSSIADFHYAQIE